MNLQETGVAETTTDQDTAAPSYQTMAHTPNKTYSDPTTLLGYENWNSGPTGAEFNEASLGSGNGAQSSAALDSTAYQNWPTGYQNWMATPVNAGGGVAHSNSVDTNRPANIEGHYQPRAGGQAESPQPLLAEGGSSATDVYNVLTTPLPDDSMDGASPAYQVLTTPPDEEETVKPGTDKSPTPLPTVQRSPASVPSSVAVPTTKSRVPRLRAATAPNDAPHRPTTWRLSHAPAEGSA